MTSTFLTDCLRRVRKRTLLVGLSAGVGWALLVWLVFLAISMWVDLVLELPPSLRLTSTCVAMAFGLGWAAWAAWSVVRRSRPGDLARKMDAVARTGGQILSGVDLLLDSRPRKGLARGLAEMAVDRAARLAGRVSTTSVVPARPVNRAFGVLGGALLATGALGLALPGLVGTQWARFFDPFDDHPPYSRVTFSVDPGSATVVYGDPLEIHARTRGPIVDRLELVLSTNGGTSEETLPMFPENDGSWRTSIAHVTDAAQYFIRAHRARSKRYSIGVITVPRLDQARFRVTPPAYTHLKPYEGPLPQGGLAGLPGTRVEVWLKSNRPLSGGDVQLETQQEPGQVTLQPTVPGGNEATGSFEIRRPGKVSMGVTDIEGQASRDRLTAAITVLSDQRPFVRLLEPQAISLATPDAVLPVVMAAEDDYGISRLQLFRNLNESRALPQDIEVPPPAPTRRGETTELALSQCKLEPGDEIKLYARVEDTDPAGVKGSESAISVVRIISQADYEKMMLMREGLEMMQSKYQEAQRRMEAITDEIDKLKKELEKEPPDSELSREMQRRLEELTKRMGDEADEIREAAGHKLPYDLDKYLTPELMKLAKSLDEAARELEQLRKKETQDGKGGFPSVKGPLDKLKELSECLGGRKQDFEERATEPIEHLAKIFPLLEDEARYLNLYARQRDLAERLASLKGRDNEDDPELKARMRDLEAEQQRLREDLRELLDDIEDHVAQLPEDERLDEFREMASKFAKDVRASGAAEAMAEAEEGLAAFSGTRGHAGAQEAADILDQFISRCNSMGNGGKSCLKFSPTLASGLGNSIEQLLESMGMSMGSSGVGPAGASGYSASRNSLQNVGLYGQLPIMSQTTAGGQGKDRMAALPSRQTGSGADEHNPWAVDPGGKLQAAGAASAIVPVTYRSRVGSYFQRVADETGK
ncbi:MAG TPA: hypothetical protein PLL20_09050 [Phycisphaerae bacterium]|mgnify:CR=1 FL=1|nr:hypothetical protein [Phycisphaerae bacterium]HRR87126.1 hypothetical protein [Phycisphaerae bacterium]